MTQRHAAFLAALVVTVGQLLVAAPAAGRVVEDRGFAPVVVSKRAAASPVPALRWPVVAPVAALFDPPATPWSSGHRGVDLVAAVGTPVAAMADGTVGFAGPVAGVWWVSLDHGPRVRTTIGPVAVAFVSPGQEVAAGQVVATAAGTAHGGSTGLVHLSLRVDGEYVDPLDHLGRLVATLRVQPASPPGE